MNDPKLPTVAVVGGGFSGTMTAVNLARFCQQRLRICLFNRGAPPGRGVAYGTRRPEHLLNVVARNMSALADEPNNFVQWLRTRSEFADTPEAELRETFAPRKIYGDYLCSLLYWHSQPAAKGPAAQIEAIESEVIDIEVHGSGAVVVAQDREPLEVDRVVLALGNQPPSELPGGDAPFHHPRYVQNPWSDWESRLPSGHGTAVLLGTGLTMVDAFLTLMASEWQGPIVAVSRNGLLPLSHFRGVEYADFPPPSPETLGLAGLAKAVDEHCAILRNRGENPAIVVDKLRSHTQRIWQSFSLEEKQAFCRRYRAKWNVTRHRIAAPVHELLLAAIESGRLRVEKGTICGLTASGQQIKIACNDANGRSVELAADLIVNCTGPQESFSASASRLTTRLFQRGLIARDELDMGITVAADFAVVDAKGRRSNVMYAMGPLLKGSLWETTAVPELRGQAFQIAQQLLGDLGLEHPKQPETWSAYDAELLEYCI